uniref:Capsid protein n=1 Tax=Gammatorquevirus homidi2 TaxID=3048387 RepID=A0AAU8H5Y9_9VIRU
MPFWWRRRKRYYRPWNKRWRKFSRRRKRPRIRRRRRTRRTYRRRRKRRHFKVKRKRKLITVKQWQPDSIVTCKIKGVEVLVLGAEGKQFVCYTNVKQATPPPKAPGGGGFACMQFSLGYLYEQYKFRNNIWTKSNIARDLCRYLRVKFTFYRHPETDFIVRYDRQPPFNIEPLTYPLCHPQNLLLGKHKIIILSKSSKPNGKAKKVKVIKPPKQMITKWFFQHQFAAAPLLQLTAAAANLQYAHIGCCNKNAIVTFKALNPGFYKNGNWAQHQGETRPYTPYVGTPIDLYFWDTTQWPKECLEETTDATFIKQHSLKVTPTSYTQSIGYSTGYFARQVLNAVLVTRDLNKQHWQAALPTITCRYNPAKDTGKGNTVWLHSNLTASYDKPTSDKTVIIQGIPIWMALYGWLSYVQHVKGAPDFYISYTCCIESPAIDVSSTPGATTTIIPIDDTFMRGQPPYGQDLSNFDITHWYPDIYNQAETLNNLVTVGPYIPKYNQTRNSTWELHTFYEFLFKWGGPEITEPPVADPSSQPVYDAFDKQPGSVQIRNPFHQKYESIIHPWDYRRGILKSAALKRIADNMSTESSFQEDEYIPKRARVIGPCLTVPEQENKEIKACLQELCKESTLQEAQEEENIIQLINQQRQQQQELKYNLLRLISELKEQQQQLKLQTGLI